MSMVFQGTGFSINDSNMAWFVGPTVTHIDVPVFAGNPGHQFLVVNNGSAFYVVGVNTAELGVASGSANYAYCVPT